MIASIAARRAASGIAWLVAAILVVFLAYALVKRSDTPVASLRVDRPAPNFTLITYTGERLTLEDLRGRPVVVNYWASWCVPCRDEAKVLERGWQQYRERDVVFIGINVQDTDTAAQRFIREFSVTYPNGPDPKGEIAIDYGMIGVPETYFISRDGQIVRKYVGPLKEGALRAHLEELLQ